MIKIQFYNSAAGTLTVTPDPEGADDFEQTIKRSDATDGVVFEYSLDLQFNKQAKAYLRDVFDLAGGIEAIVVVNLFEYRPNAFRYEQIGAGTIKFINFKVGTDSLKTSIEQTGLIRKVINLMDTDLDLDTQISQGKVTLPATAFLDLELHSKAIIKQTISLPSELVETQQLSVWNNNDIPGAQTTFRERVIIGTLATDKQTTNELTESFQYPFGWLDAGLGLGMNAPGLVADYITFLNANLGFRNPIYVATEAGVLTARPNLNLKHGFTASDPSGDIDICGSGALGKIEVHAWYEHRDADNNILDLQHIGEWNQPQCGEPGNTGNASEGAFETHTITVPAVTVNVGDKIYIYETVRIWGDYENTDIGDEDVDHHFRITPGASYEIDLSSKTTTPTSTAKAYLIYEALNKMFQFYTDQVDCFRSSYFGRTDSSPAYDEDGPGALNSVLSGANIRQVDGRTTFVNGTDFFGALNAIHCLGLGFEFRDGVQVAVVEPLRYFYNKNLLIMDLGPVSDFERIVHTKSYGNQIEFNFGKIDIQKTNGIDEFGTLRRWRYPITQISTKQQATTKYKISGYEIEDQRRLITSTQDSKNDENNFFINLVRDGGGFKPATDEDYILIENLFDPSSAYNINLSPRRNADNWLEFMAISLYKSLDKVVQFSAGEGNYQMRTQKTGEAEPKEEGGPIDLTGVSPLFMPELYKFTCPLTSTQMSLIRQSPYGYFKFQEYRGGPDLEGFLYKCTRKSKNKLGTFELLKVFR